MLRLASSSGRYMTDCRGEFPDSWFRCGKRCARIATTRAELLPRQRIAVARRMAAERVDSPPGSARMVSVVLPLLHGAPEQDDGRQIRRWRAIARHASAIRKHLRAWRSRVPPEARRRCCIGPTTAGRFDTSHSHRHLIVPARRRRTLRRRTQARRVSHRDVRAIRGVGAGVP